MASSVIDPLAQTVDEHIAWLLDWQRLAFFESENRARQAELLDTPPSFALWRQSSVLTLPKDQPAVERLASLHEQLHTLAKLVLMKTPDGEGMDAGDYDGIIAKYKEFMKDLRRMERAFSAAASKLDILTGLRTRVGLLEDLHREQSRFVRNGKPYCIAIMDIDHFKKINDSYGHEAGDRVLASVADAITRGLRPFDDAYRMGGEEFLLFLKEADLAGGKTAIERLRASLEKNPVVLAGGRKVPVTASFGLVVSVKEATTDDMLKRADQALYQAKEQGRNRVIAG